jgi:uncharacterized protein YndB with AHSA1/START domain
MSGSLVFSRVLGAPIERVWNSWSDPEQMLRWLGGHGKHLLAASVEELVPRERLVCVLRFARKKGVATLRSEVAFKDLGDGRTKVTVTAMVLPVAAR